MRIALIAPLVTAIREPQQGGAQAFVADLAQGLVVRGHTVDVYAARGSAIPCVNMVDLGIDSEPLTAALYRPGATVAPDPGIMEAAFDTVYSHVRGVPYDVVHNHAFDAPALRLAAAVDSAVVHTLHLPPSQPIIEAVAEVEQGDRPPVVATVSQFCAAAWRAVVPIDSILRSNVPVRRIPWSARPGSGALFAGRLSPEKGAVQAIEIARSADLTIDLYGDPYDADYARESIDPWRDKPGVRIHAGIRRPDLWEKMMRAAVVLCPALWDEPFGMVAAEAQACGTPVVASVKGAFSENLVDGVTGLLVQPDSIQEAARAAVGAATLSRTACRRHAETHLDLESSLDVHEALYQRLAERQEARACA